MTQTYDANSNLLNDGVNTFSWNARNQLASIAGSVTASFQYDPFGRRISKTVGGVTTGFMYNGMNVVQELSAGAPSANLLTGGIDEIFSRADTSGRSFLTDGLGSTLALTDATGTITTQYTFDPFGNTSTSGSTSSNAFQYTGRENDGTGLYFYRARYYSSLRQRFISQDPIGFWGGDTNLYAYAFNSPLNFSDPSGYSAGAIPWGTALPELEQAEEETAETTWELGPEVMVPAMIGVGGIVLLANYVSTHPNTLSMADTADPNGRQSHDDDTNNNKIRRSL